MSEKKKKRRLRLRRPLFLLFLAGGLLVGGLTLAALVNNQRFHCSLNRLPVVYAADTATTTQPPDTAVPLPEPSDWVDYGPVMETGGEGAWDFQWAGLTPASVIKKDGTYYFYYVASDGPRSFDGGPRHRAIGVATSPDGIRFTKYDGNPIITYAPFNGEEEGANSAGVTLDATGQFVMVYGAAQGRSSIIVADGRVALSDDGLHFTDAGQVISHCDPTLYGFGDEIFPVAVFQHQDNWIVYYVPNGAIGSRTMGAVWGPNWGTLPHSAMVLDETSGGRPVDPWGNVVWLGPTQIALFIQRLWSPDTFIEVRTADPHTPHQLSEPVMRYDIPNLKRGTVFLDRERNTWFMYYNDFDNFWDVKLAPAGEPDTTPPTAPENVTAVATAKGDIALSWEAALDADTGVVQYIVYRDSV